MPLENMSKVTKVQSTKVNGLIIHNFSTLNFRIDTLQKKFLRKYYNNHIITGCFQKN